MKHCLEIDSVILEFGNRKILQDVYIKIEVGEITGLLGRNGCGKTSLLRILCGDLAILNKSVRFDGVVASHNPNRFSDIQYLPQFSFLPKHLTLKRVFDDYQIDYTRFLETFPEFDRHYLTKVNNLSGGEKRLIEVVVVLMSKAKVCLLDEPFSQIMPLHVERLKSIIKSEKRTKGILVTDHLYEHIVQLSDRLYVIFNGKTHVANGIEDLPTFGYLAK